MGMPTGLGTVFGGWTLWDASQLICVGAIVLRVVANLRFCTSRSAVSPVVLEDGRGMTMHRMSHLSLCRSGQLPPSRAAGVGDVGERCALPGGPHDPLVVWLDRFVIRSQPRTLFFGWWLFTFVGIVLSYSLHSSHPACSVSRSRAGRGPAFRPRRASLRRACCGWIRSCYVNRSDALRSTVCLGLGSEVGSLLRLLFACGASHVLHPIFCHHVHASPRPTEPKARSFDVLRARALRLLRSRSNGQIGAFLDLD